MSLKINGWKMYFLLKWSFFGGHVNFQGCIYLEIVVISGGPMDPLSVALAAADGSSQSWNEVYQHPKGCRDDYMQRFNAARQIEMAAIASVKKLLQSQKHMSHHPFGLPVTLGLKRRMLERYVKHCGLDVDLCVGTLILALNQLERVTTLSSCNSVHVGAHEEEALVAFTTKSMQKLEILKKELGEHLREVRRDVVQPRKAGQKAEVFASYIVTWSYERFWGNKMGHQIYRLLER